MKICEKCGHNNMDFAKFCTKCGNNLDIHVEKQTESGKAELKKPETPIVKQNKSPETDRQNIKKKSDLQKPEQNNTEKTEIRLIKCIACGNMISNEALSCPHCGQPTAVGKKKQIQEEEKRKEDQKTEAWNNNVKAYAIASIIVLIIGLGGFIVAGHGLFTMVKDIADYRSGWGYSYKGRLTDHELSVITQMIVGVIFWIVMMITSRKLLKKFKEEERRYKDNL